MFSNALALEMSLEQRAECAMRVAVISLKTLKNITLRNNVPFDFTNDAVTSISAEHLSWGKKYAPDALSIAVDYPPRINAYGLKTALVAENNLLKQYKLQVSNESIYNEVVEALKQEAASERPCSEYIKDSQL